MAFKYRERTYEDVRARATQRSGFSDNWLKQGVSMFKPSEGMNTIRFIPIPASVFDKYPDLNNHYGMDVAVHYNVGDRNSYPCLQAMKKQPCPVCEYRQQLDSEGADKEELRPLEARKAIICYVLDRNKEQEGPLVWAMPVSVDKEFSMLAMDEDTSILPLDDPDKGYDVSFRKTGTGLTTKYDGKKIAHKHSYLCRKESEQEKFLDFVDNNPLPELIQWFTYEEIAASLNGRAPTAQDDDGRRGSRLRDQLDRDRDDDRGERTTSRRGRDEEDERPARGRARDDADEDRTARRGREAEDEPPRRRPPAEEERVDRETGEILPPDDDRPARGRGEPEPEDTMQDGRRRAAMDEAGPPRARGRARDEQPAERETREDDRGRSVSDDPPARHPATETRPERRRPAENAKPASTTEQGQGRLSNLRGRR